MAERHTFQAEIKQLLQILVHSLYKDRDIFLRELISNASDALNKLQFEMLTTQDILNPDAELCIELIPNAEENTLTIVDTGIGMTHDEMVDNLGFIARSGARDFLERVKNAESGQVSSDLIGQFGVGFYSVFMVAERVEVTSRSFQPGAEAYLWISEGEDSYEIAPAQKETRGTEIKIFLREDATEFTSDYSLRNIVKKHSDYVAFPIYLISEEAPAEDDGEASTPEVKRELINQQTALWRRSSAEVDEDSYNDFYRQLTMDFQPPLYRIQARGDAPIQYYALLYIPHSAEASPFSLRREPGLKLYARKVLIQEYNTDLLPEYLRFVQGVVDSEDLPLNVSRETVQANPQMNKLRQTLTRRVLGDLKRLAENEPEQYQAIWEEYSTFLKHGVVSDFSERERLLPLLRFHSSQQPDSWTSLADYVSRMVEGQDKIYYIVAENPRLAAQSPHLDPFRARNLEVLYLTEAIDGFLVTTLRSFEGHDLASVDAADLDLEGVGTAPEEAAEAPEPVADAELAALLTRMKEVLGEQVEKVRVSKVLAADNAARLVVPEGALDRHTQRVYQMLNQDYEEPARILEINPRHPIVRNLAAQLSRQGNSALVEDSINVMYESALLADGIHPDPATLVRRIQSLMEAATRID